MTEFLKTITDFIKEVADRYGAKTVVVIVAIGVLGYLCYYDKIGGLYAAASIAAICVAFFIWRHIEDVTQTNKEVK